MRPRPRRGSSRPSTATAAGAGFGPRSQRAAITNGGFMRVGADRHLHPHPDPQAQRQTADAARHPEARVHPLRRDLPADRHLSPDAAAVLDLHRDLPADRAVRPGVVRLGLPADRLHGVPLPAARAPDRRRSQTADQALDEIGAQRPADPQVRRCSSSFPPSSPTPSSPTSSVGTACSAG